jgi:hypothetical protein
MQITPALCSKGFLLPAAGIQSPSNGLIHALTQLPWALQQIQQLSTCRQHTPLLSQQSSWQCQQGICNHVGLPNSSSLISSQLQQNRQPLLLQQRPGFLQQRWYSANDEVARQRLVAAHQRRQREQEALQRRRGSITAASSSSSSTELQDAAGTAVVPLESPPAETQVGSASNRLLGSKRKWQHQQQSQQQSHCKHMQLTSYSSGWCVSCILGKSAWSL